MDLKTNPMLMEGDLIEHTVVASECQYLKNNIYMGKIYFSNE
jgi:hypothetical protein